MKKFIITIAVITSLSLTACQMNKENMGQVSGGVIGGVLGSQVGKGRGQVVATGAGVLLGAMIGGNIGKQLDERDRLLHNQALTKSYSAPLNKPITWENSNTGHSGSVTPIRQGRMEDNRVCREFEQTIRVDGQQEAAIGTACQNPNGTWEIIK